MAAAEASHKLLTRSDSFSLLGEGVYGVNRSLIARGAPRQITLQMSHICVPTR